jgi:hypothetical protein
MSRMPRKPTSTSGASTRRSTAAAHRTHEPKDGEGLVSLYFVGAIDVLATEDGRRRMAARFRESFSKYRDTLGLEQARYLKAAHAIEAQDWRTLGHLLRDVERDRWQRCLVNVAHDRRDHAAVLQLARALQAGVLPIGEAV